MSSITRRSALFMLASAGVGLAVPVLASQDTSQELASKGHELLLSGKPAEALAALKEAARLDPANPWVFNLLGRAYYQSGQASQAEESFRMALRIDPGDGYSRMMLDILFQHPVPPVPPSGRKPAKHKKTSQLEEEARRELDGFAKSGKASTARLILIDPGHGGMDKGVTGSLGLAEKNVTLDLAIRVVRAVNAEDSGVMALLTRERDLDEPLWARSAMAGIFGADLFVSMHCSASLPGKGGVELYSYSAEPSDAQAHAVAELENGVTRFERFGAPKAPLPSVPDFLSSWQTRQLAARSRDVAQRMAAELKPDKPLEGVHLSGAPLKVLLNSRCPAVLIEAGFLSNFSEEAALKNGEYREKLAVNLAKALTRSLG